MSDSVATLVCRFFISKIGSFLAHTNGRYVSIIIVNIVWWFIYFDSVLDPNPFPCTKCTKVFKTISKYNYHQKDCHPEDDSQKHCNLCNKTFAAVSIKQRHENTGCPKERTVVWVPPAPINKDETNNRHVMQRNQLSEKNVQIIDRFREYLTDGSTSVVILSRGKQNLEPSSVDSYVSHFRVYAGFVEVSHVYFIVLTLIVI